MAKNLAQGAVLRISVLDWSVAFSGTLRKPPESSLDGGSPECFFHGKPLRNWLFRESLFLLRKADGDCTITVRYVMKRPLEFRIQEQSINARRLDIRLICRLRAGKDGQVDGLQDYLPIPASEHSGMPEIDREIDSRTVTTERCERSAKPGRRNIKRL